MFAVSRMALVVSLMLASFQLLAQAQGKERPMEALLSREVGPERRAWKEAS
jgi:hypothetical protein